MRHLDILVLSKFFLFFIHIQEVKLMSRQNRMINFNKFYHKPNSYYLSHILNTYRKNNNFDYDYDDWENNDAVFKYDKTAQLNSTEEANKTTASTTNNKTEETTITNIETTDLINATAAQDTEATHEGATNETRSIPITTNVITTAIDTTEPINNTEVSNVNGTGVESSTTKPLVTNTTIEMTTHTTTTTKLPETEDLLQLFVTTTPVSNITVPNFNLETYFPGTTFDILDFTTPFQTTTKQPFIGELKETSKTDGFFTSSLIVLFRILSKKNPKDISPLLAALNWNIERLNAEDRLLMFGGNIAEVFQSMVQMLTLEPVDVMQNHFNYAVYALENRRAILKEDTNVLTDIADTVYIEADLDDIAIVLKDISNYPNGTDSAGKIIRTAMQAFVFTPFLRIVGTARERFLIIELNNVINKRLYPGENIQ